ncbi:hypothetical protein MMC24_005843 [Lignoscripta atroalba]|nr:hypothetical protein [Lignoscripta atroalba]
MTTKTVVTINSNGRQAASLIRAVSAVGYHVRAQLLTREGIVAQELEGLKNVTIVEGSLEDKGLVQGLFTGAQLAFINTTPWGDEVAIGKSLADAAKKAGIQHYIYSSMPDHSVFGQGWPALPQWSTKFTIENYVRQLGLPATFVYTGIYNNNFTSLPYPLFCMELQEDGAFEWKGPFHPDVPLPWLDAEHDVGPAVLQIFKDGPRKWAAHRYVCYSSPVHSWRPCNNKLNTDTPPFLTSIALAFELLSPTALCVLFSKGVRRPVRYVRTPTIDIRVSIPNGYREQLEGIQVLFGEHNAPYFGPDLEAPDEALGLWEGYRGIEEYAREVFPVEEANNGMTWMN